MELAINQVLNMLEKFLANQLLSNILVRSHILEILNSKEL